MAEGISNFQIEEAFKSMKDQGIGNNFVGAFPSNYMNKFIDHTLMISEKKGKFPFIIANIGASSKQGTHW